jgi:hypothetical protein
MQVVIERTKLIFSDRTLWSLLGANALTFIVAHAYGWGITELLWTYWLQNIAIGAVNVVRILRLKEYSTDNFLINNVQPPANTATKRYVAGFFAFHYGFFHFGYLVFLMKDANLAFSLGTLMTAATFFFNHLFSYFKNLPYDGPATRIGTIMFRPYLRIIPMHVFIMIASVTGFFAVPIFVLVKTVIDLISHVASHSTKGTALHADAAHA